ncbi:hypothetical protein [Clostridium felsineum]|uniref:Uncharacterized protein n=1 Tax=Clostridium felsineum TaxID=36839 RepID=A0A1S8KZS9_9CLOT|nr:hypothetical protein [Clostridium felsineum]URZ06503.1 hypothetical protein CLROS_018360 [Clostridium felsineum]URZ11538.1 hypothetical protein CROST_022550 [Clostridium felsineum]
MSDLGGLSLLEKINMDIEKADFNSDKEREDIKLKVLNKYTRWSCNDYLQYERLLDKLKEEKDKKHCSQVEIGKALENIVTFIFEKSYFYKVYPNKRTSTHEIDQFVVLSDKGEQAIYDYHFSRKLLISEQDYFLCECKNYKTKVQATWVGKFYTLLKVSGDCTVGIIFSCNGLTGKENNWYDGHGLTKTIYRISNSTQHTYILDFNLNDFKLLLDNKNTIFSIILNKKRALVANVKSVNLIDSDYLNNNEIEKIYKEISQG